MMGSVTVSAAARAQRPMRLVRLTIQAMTAQPAVNMPVMRSAPDTPGMK